VLAEAVPGFFPDVELDALEAAAHSSPRASGYLVEIGAYCGRSTLVLAAVAAERGMRLISIDHHRASTEMRPPFPWADPRLLDHDLSEVDSLGVARDALWLAGLEASTITVIAESRALVDLVRPVAGFVLIDGGHDARSAHLDLELARVVLAPGGVLAIHDVFENPALGGQAPWRMTIAAEHLGFRRREQIGSLALLVRVADAPPGIGPDHEARQA